MEDPTRAVAPALEDLIALPEPAANANWWQQNAFDARSIDMLKEHARPVGHRGRYAVDLYTADQMREMRQAAFEAGRAKGLEEAKQACEAEDLEDPPKYPEDRAYCRAIQDCIDAIEALRSLAPAVPT